MANPEIAQSLPVLSQNTNSIRTHFYTLGSNNSQMPARMLLQTAGDNIAENTRQFKEYLRKLYEVTQSQNTNFQYDMRTTSEAFDTISNHISSFVRDASNSSIFERADKLKIMKYIQSAIERANIDDREKRQLLEQYQYASSTLRASAGIFDKASASLSQNIGTFTSIIGRTFDELPPVVTLFLSKGRDLISSWLQRRKEKKDRQTALENNIWLANGAHVITPPSLVSNNAAQRPILERQTTNRVNNLTDTSNIIRANQTKKSDRIRETSGSLIDKAPVGTASDPFCVVIQNKELLNNAQKKDKPGFLSFLPALGMLVFKPLKRLVMHLVKLLSGIASFLGLKKGASKLAELAENVSPNIKAPEVPLTRIPDTPVPDTKAGTQVSNGGKTGAKTARKQVAKKTAGTVLKRVGKTALSLGAKALGLSLLGPLALPVGLAMTAYDTFSLYNDLKDIFKNTPEKSEKDASVVPNDGSQSETTKQKIFEDTTAYTQDNGAITAAKNSSRASLEEQSKQATSARAQATETRNMQVNQQNTTNSQVINNTTFNQSTTNQTNRIIQITNPQAYLVNGSR